MSHIHYLTVNYQKPAISLVEGEPLYIRYVVSGGATRTVYIAYEVFKDYYKQVRIDIGDEFDCDVASYSISTVMPPRWKNCSVELEEHIYMLREVTKEEFDLAFKETLENFTL